MKSRAERLQEILIMLSDDNDPYCINDAREATVELFKECAADTIEETLKNIEEMGK